MRHSCLVTKKFTYILTEFKSPKYSISRHSAAVCLSSARSEGITEKRNLKKFQKCAELRVGQSERCVRAILPSRFQPALQETQELIQVQSHVCRPPEAALYLCGKPQTLMEDRERILETGLRHRQRI